jgi:hypothetical protein
LIGRNEPKPRENIENQYNNYPLNSKHGKLSIISEREQIPSHEEGRRDREFNYSS